MIAGANRIETQRIDPGVEQRVERRAAHKA
jgi:hypothetical protein